MEEGKKTSNKKIVVKTVLPPGLKKQVDNYARINEMTNS